MSCAAGPEIKKDGLIFLIDGRSTKVRQNTNLLDTNFPKWSIGTGSSSGYGQNGDGNSRILDTTPWDNLDIVWDVSNQDATSDADGGWNTSSFTVDPTKMYRYSVWQRRKVVGNGSYYLGCQGNVLNRSNNVLNTNPYFSAAGWGFGANVWVLMVGHIWPQGSGSGSVHVDTGIYNIDGTKLSTPGDFISNGATTGVHRTYLYYSTDTATNQQFYQPRVDVCDGSEPSIQELLNNPINLDVTKKRNINLSKTQYNVSNNFQFNGVDNIINVDLGGLTNLYAFDIWMYNYNTIPNNDTAIGGPSTYQSLFSFGVATAGINFGGWTGSGTNEAIHIWSNGTTNGSGFTYTNSRNWAPGWYNLCANWNGTTYDLWMNGEKQTTLSNPTCKLLNVSQIRIGGEGVSQAYYFNGEISKFSTYSVALTDNEIKQNFNALRGRYGI